MNLRFVGNDLYKGFNLATSIVPSSAIKHVLQGVKLEVIETDSKPNCTITATDLEVLIKYTLPVVESAGAGSIILPAVRVNNIFREWAGNNAEVLLSLEGSSCVLKSGKGYFKIVGEDAGQFPVINDTDVKSFVEIEGGIIGDMVGKVAHAVSAVRARSSLCGIYIKVEKDEIVMVAADGNRLSMVKRKVENLDGVLMEGIVTVKCLTFLQRFSSENKGTIRVGIGESQILFKGEKGEIVSQLIEGKYPRYEDVIPTNNDRKIEVKRDDLFKVVRMASFMTSEGYSVVRFVFKEGRLLLLSKAAEVGEAELEIEAGYKGEDFEISFNPEYVLDVLKVAESETIVIECKDNGNAALFRTGHEQLSVIMPIELK